MSPVTIVILLIALVFVVLMGVVTLKVLEKSRHERSRSDNLRGIGRYDNPNDDQHSNEEEDEYHDDLSVEVVARKKKSKSKEPTVDELLFMAGRLSQSERERFLKRRRLAPLAFGFAGLLAGLIDGSAQMLLISGVLGILLGLYLPMKILRGWVKQQHEELSYYLPLLIEQISIGVSSSLDIGPCIGQLVQMADERDSHNATTELLKYALYYVKSGVNLEQALAEIGRASGQPEFKQALLALSQVTKFGGEVSRQLQELADSVASQREVMIDGEIRKLELKATGPVSMVFLSFVVLLGLGIVAQIMIGTGS
jgi:Flp pilus assembly protein TadB